MNNRLRNFLVFCLIVVALLWLLTVFFEGVAAAQDGKPAPDAVHLIAEARRYLISADDAVLPMFNLGVRRLETGQGWEELAYKNFQKAAENADTAIQILLPLAEDPRPPVRAIACWYLGNARLWKLVSALRLPYVYKSHSAALTELREARAGYTCALRALAAPQSEAQFERGGDDGQTSADYEDIVRKNLLLVSDFTKRLNDKSGTNLNQRMDTQIERAIMEAVKQNFAQGEPVSRDLVPIPGDDSVPQGYGPGTLTGVH